MSNIADGWSPTYRAYLNAFTMWRRTEDAFDEHPSCAALEVLNAAEARYREARAAYDQELLTIVFTK